MAVAQLIVCPKDPHLQLISFAELLGLQDAYYDGLLLYSAVAFHTGSHIYVLVLFSV